MKRIIATTIIILQSIMIFAQLNDEAENEALQCLNEKLLLANLDINGLLSIEQEYQAIIAAENIEALELKNNEMDSIFTSCGLFANNHLNLGLIIDCMENEQILENDSSSYSLLLEHFIYLKENPTVFYELSPVIHMSALNIAIDPTSAKKDFYKTIKFIFLQGVFKEGRNYILYNNQESTIEGDSLEIITIELK